MRQGTPRTLRIAYEGTFRDRPPKAPVNMDDPTFGVAAIILPAGTFLGEEAAWYPQSVDARPTFRLRV